MAPLQTVAATKWSMMYCKPKGIRNTSTGYFDNMHACVPWQGGQVLCVVVGGQRGIRRSRDIGHIFRCGVASNWSSWSTERSSGPHVDLPLYVSWQEPVAKPLRIEDLSPLCDILRARTGGRNWKRQKKRKLPMTNRESYLAMHSFCLPRGIKEWVQPTS